ncbi:MAG: hypothetical protein KatS3mg118_0015 [Paracoccaceae bacterium]|nr:MAG: acetyl-CoA carboxylase biotin carboxyl carrier protein subunit [Alphaproteobacteria bacterium]GIX12056.1 MAG: hypothetical protein KatS3mg118_0015 [Paracoccaceae bacterium]
MTADRGESAGWPVAEEDIRQLIAAFRESGCAALELRLPGLRLALRARPSGGAGAASILSAPSPGVFRPRVSAGMAVAAGAILAEIGRAESAVPLVAAEPGRVAELLAPAGAFVEYGQPLVAFAPGQAPATGAGPAR